MRDNRYLRDRMIDRHYRARNRHRARRYEDERPFNRGDGTRYSSTPDRERSDYRDYMEYRVPYNREYMDYDDYDYAEMDREYKDDIKRWGEKLKRKDKFGLGKQDIINKAQQMGVRFEEFTEEEFITAYYYLMSIFKNISNDPHMYLSMTKDWLEEEEIAVSPNEKISIILYKIIKGE